jgi:hypothetical protein
LDVACTEVVVVVIEVAEQHNVMREIFSLINKTELIMVEAYTLATIGINIGMVTHLLVTMVSTWLMKTLVEIGVERKKRFLKYFVI